MPTHSEAIEALARYEVRISPSERVRAGALVRDYDAWYAEWERDPEAFWERAANELFWFEPWTKVCEIALPSHRWFVGGKTNLSYNCLERNVERGLGDKVCFHFESEHGESASFTYREVLAEVAKTANALSCWAWSAATA